MSIPPLYTLDPLNRFSDRAADYVKYRPSYPDAAIDAILSGLAAQLTVADIGAGTGISSRLLADRGLNVIAIEPNQAMSNLADPHPRVEFCQGTAEQTGLPDQAVDLITCFQAFHWFNPEIALSEFHRVLKPSGRVALVWNSRDLSDPFTHEYGELVRAASEKHPALDRMETLPTDPQFQNFRELRFPFAQAQDFQSLVGNTRSRSYVSTDPEILHELIEHLEGLHQRYADEQGFVYMKYQTKVFLGETRP